MLLQQGLRNKFTQCKRGTSATTAQDGRCHKSLLDGFDRHLVLDKAHKTKHCTVSGTLLDRKQYHFYFSKTMNGHQNLMWRSLKLAPPSLSLFCSLFWSREALQAHMTRFQLILPVANHNVTKNLTGHRMHVEGPQIYQMNSQTNSFQNMCDILYSEISDFQNLSVFGDIYALYYFVCHKYR